MHLFSSVRKVGQMQGMMHLCLFARFHAHHRHPGGLAARVELNGHRLHLTCCQLSILEPDGERPQPMHPCSLALKQQTRSFLRAWHQRLFVAIQDKNGHKEFLAFLSPKGDPRKGLVTRLSRRRQAAPLANVQQACHVQDTDPTPAGLLTLDGRSTRLRWRPAVP